jgi:hypothetical protein
MNTRTVWTLLLGAGLVAVAGTAMADDDDLDELIFDDGCDDDGAALVAVTDFSRDSVRETSREQQVDADEDDVLLGIALANNGADDISWNKLRDVSLTETKFARESQQADLDRDDVFSALALGLESDASSLEALACVSDIEMEHRETTTLNRVVDLDEDDVLLAIALANSVDSDLEFDDIADISENARSEISTERIVDIDRDDTFLALALGAGNGSDGISAS